MALTKLDKEFINLVLEPIRQDVSDIKAITSATNGKVRKHENQITEILTERKGNREKQEHYFKKTKGVDIRVDALEKAELNHIITCPVSPKLRILEDKMLEFMVDIKAKTKIFSKAYQIIFLTIMMASLGLALYNTAHLVKKTKENNNKEVVYNDSNGVIILTHSSNY